MDMLVLMSNPFSTISHGIFDVMLLSSSFHQLMANNTTFTYPFLILMFQILDISKQHFAIKQLYHAISKNKLDIIELLLENGLDPNDQGIYIQTADPFLHHSSLPVTQTLIQYGAFVNIENYYGWLPIEINKHHDIGLFLLSHGSKPSSSWNA